MSETPTSLEAVSIALSHVADAIVGEIKNARSSAMLSDLMDIHGEAVRYQQSIEAGIPVSLDAVEVLLARYGELPKR